MAPRQLPQAEDAVSIEMTAKQRGIVFNNTTPIKEWLMWGKAAHWLLTNSEGTRRLTTSQTYSNDAKLLLCYIMNSIITYLWLSKAYLGVDQ